MSKKAKTNKRQRTSRRSSGAKAKRKAKAAAIREEESRKKREADDLRAIDDPKFAMQLAKRRGLAPEAPKPKHWDRKEAPAPQVHFEVLNLLGGDV